MNRCREVFGSIVVIEYRYKRLDALPWCTTLSYTIGAVGARSVRTVVVTNTVTEVISFTTRVIVDVELPTVALFTTTQTPSPTADSHEVTSTTLPPLPSRASPPNNLSAAAGCATAVPRAPIQDGIVSGCTKYYVAVPGDYCVIVADKCGIPVHTFMDWNPAVIKGACTNMLAGDAYRVATCASSLSTTSTFTSTSSQAPTTTITSASRQATTSTFTTSSAPCANSRERCVAKG